MDNNDTTHAGPRPLYEEPRSCMEGTKSSIKKLMEDTLEDAIGRGIDVLHHLHSIMLTATMDIRWICVQKETNTSHPQAIFSLLIVEMGIQYCAKKIGERG